MLSHSGHPSTQRLERSETLLALLESSDALGGCYHAVGILAPSACSAARRRWRCWRNAGGSTQWLFTPRVLHPAAGRIEAPLALRTVRRCCWTSTAAPLSRTSCLARAARGRRVSPLDFVALTTFRRDASVAIAITAVLCSTWRTGGHTHCCCVDRSSSATDAPPRGALVGTLSAVVPSRSNGRALCRAPQRHAAGASGQANLCC